jgi:hypothetical protein
MIDITRVGFNLDIGVPTQVLDTKLIMEAFGLQHNSLQQVIVATLPTFG